MKEHDKCTYTCTYTVGKPRIYRREGKPDVKRPAPHGHCEIRRSDYLEDQNCLRIEWMSDGPCDETLKKFIAQEWPELKDKEIVLQYDDPEWISEWNLGKQQGCFSLLVLFFKKD